MAKELCLVTGGAGFIGSHLVDALIRDGFRVRVLDTLSPPAHNGKLPPWFNKHTEFIKGDVRNKKDWIRALKNVDYVFHLAAYMDIFPDFSTYFLTNAAGTALMYEVIVEKKLTVKKIVAASSQAVYGEGNYSCSKHGIFYPDFRPLAQLRKKQWEVQCPCGRCRLTQRPQQENDILKPVPPYGASKVALEHIIFTLGRLYNIPSVALRYSIVQGARQSFRHFYSGALRAYVVEGLSGLPIETHEDGNQTRDFVSIHDIVSAHLTVLKDKRANFESYNVGMGKPTRVIDLAHIVAQVLNIPAHRVRSGGTFRFATARHSPMDISKLKKLGWKPRYTIEDNVREYAEWVKHYPEALHHLLTTEKSMRKQKLLFS